MTCSNVMKFEKASFARYAGNYKDNNGIDRIEYLIFIRAVAGSFENFIKHFAPRKPIPYKI